jgi:adenylate cyclase
LLAAHEVGLAAYRARSWDAAEQAFKRSQELAPDDQLTQTYLARIAQLQLDPPDADWDGVWTLSSK